MSACCGSSPICSSSFRRKKLWQNTVRRLPTQSTASGRILTAMKLRFPKKISRTPSSLKKRNKPLYTLIGILAIGLFLTGCNLFASPGQLVASQPVEPLPDNDPPTQTEDPAPSRQSSQQDP